MNVIINLMSVIIKGWVWVLRKIVWKVERVHRVNGATFLEESA